MGHKNVIFGKSINWPEHNSFFELPHDKTNKMSVRPAKTQISLGIRPGWSESFLCAQWVAKDLMFLHVDSEDSDQAGQMPRLIRVFAGCTAILLVLSCRGSFQSVKLTFKSHKNSIIMLNWNKICIIINTATNLCHNMAASVLGGICWWTFRYLVLKVNLDLDS